MSDPRSRLQAAVGDTYAIEKELGGGGMSRVYLAEETRLGRKVVIKLLPPEMGAGVNIERFEREIQLAAQLQHPHIVPLLTAGAEGDLLWYVMPFIKGESLRAKLAREGELPIGEAVRVLRDVSAALAYAHGEGVVHRDIKPDNVLLSGGFAVVTDFGVAKAVASSTGESSLTSLGVALGTPAYMSPEQAAADPHVDHRADIYALGAMAYEMLSGRPPFTGATPQAVLAAHVTQAPEPVTLHRETVPPALAELIQRCLAKKAADRWQRADDLRFQFDAMATPTGGMTPTGTQPVPAIDYEARARQAHPVRVAALFGLASIGALAIAYGAMYLVGLPYWVFYGAIGLLIIGFPIVLLTGRRERKHAIATMTGMHLRTPSGMQRHLTWRKSLFGGGLAFAGLAVVTAGYMAMRALGIGPVGSLVASGAIDARDRIVVAQFENVTSDSTLGETVTELFGIDLAQSTIVSVLDPAQVSAVLQRMQRAPDTPFTAELATEVAEREGLKAVLTGEIRPVGGGFVLSSRLMATRTGDVLWAGRENAASGDEIVAAVDKLSESLRAKAGESLRAIRANAPLEQVTTRSMAALRLYAEGVRANDQGDFNRAIARLGEAVAEDSTFAMAHRKLGIVLRNNYLDSAREERSKQAFTRAYELRQRLTEPERYLAEAAYYSLNEDDQAEIAAYRTMLDKYPTDRVALHNLAVRLTIVGRLQEAADLYTRSIALGTVPTVTYTGAISILYTLGHTDSAAGFLEMFSTDYPDQPNVPILAASFASAKFEYDSAETILRAFRTAQRRNPTWEERALGNLSSLARVRGRLEDELRYDLERFATSSEMGRPYTRTTTRDDMVRSHRNNVAFEFHGDPGPTLRELEEDLRKDPPEVGSFLFVASRLIDLGQTTRGRQYVDRFDREADEKQKKDVEEYRPYVMALLAAAEGRATDAVVETQRYVAATTCAFCVMFDVAEVYDRAGQADSALAYLQRYLTTPWLNRLGFDSRNLWKAYQRLGELHEARGDREKAVDYYGRLVELWKGADAELQPIVDDVKARIARLVGERE